MCGAAGNCTARHGEHCALSWDGLAQMSVKLQVKEMKVARIYRKINVRNYVLIGFETKTLLQ